MTSRRTSCAAALVLALVAISLPAAAQSFLNFESGHVRPLAASPDGSRLFAVNTPDNRLAIYDVTASGLALTAEVPVGMEPVAVAARLNADGDTEAWVVNHLSDSVSVVELDTADVTRSRVTRTLLVGDEPRDIVFAGSGGGRVFVTTAHRGQNRPGDPELTTEGVGRADVWVFDAEAPGAALGGTPIAILELFGDTPRALAASPDGSTVYAAVFHSGTRTTTIAEPFVTALGGAPPPPTFAPPNAPPTGLIVKFDEATGRWEDELGRNWSSVVRFSLPDLDVFRIDADADPVPTLVNAVSGVGAVLFNMAVHPHNGKVYVANTNARNHVRFEGVVGITNPEQGVQGHVAESRITVIEDTTATPVHLNPHIDFSLTPGPRTEIEQSFAFPMDLVFSADGETLYVAGFGSEAVGVFDTSSLEAGIVAGERIPVGGGPSGLVLDETRNRLYVMSRFTHRVGIVINASNPALRALTDSVSLNFDPSPPAVTLGRRLLYDAKRTSGHGDTACASCHVFADFDSLAWDLGDPTGEVAPNPNPFVGGEVDFEFHPLKGPMTTQSLRGLADAGPMHWRGDRTGGSSGQDPLDEALAFKAFNVAFPGLLGRGSRLPEADMQAFTDFILTVRYPPNPIRALDDVAAASEAAGASFFSTQPTDGGRTCSDCHALPLGTAGLSSLEGEPQEFKVPHLRNLYQKVGMFGFVGGLGIPGTGFLGDQVRGFGVLHDGGVDTVFSFVSANVFQNLTNPLRRNLEAFLLSFDTGLAPAVGQQVSATPGTFDDADVLDRLGLLRAQAEAGACDLVVKGTIGGEQRGALYLGGDTWRSDRASDPLFGTTFLLSLSATPGQEGTFTCAPPGSGARMGIDRDEDGRFDRDELDAGTNPADPTSVVGGPILVPIQTGSLVLRDDSIPPENPTRRKITFTSNSRNDLPANRIVPPAFGAPGDPTVAGATLRVYNANGSGEQVTLSLPAAGWTTSGTDGYRFSDGSPGAIIRAVRVKPDRITITGGKANWTYTLNEPSQGRVAVWLGLGQSLAWCAEAPARASGTPPSSARNDTQDRFTAEKHAPAPAVCPPPPAG
jgi:DNA-binding beta-propeller fold protein YncE